MEFIKDLIVSIFMVATVLSIFVGVPLLIFVARRRALARMTPAQRVVQRAEEQQRNDEWHDEMMDPTNPSGWTYVVHRHDDD